MQSLLQLFRDGPVIPGLLARWDLLHLRQVWLGLRPFSLFHSFLSHSEMSSDIKEILLTRTLSLNSFKFDPKYSTGIAMLLSNVFCRDATRSAKKINPHANPALHPRNSRAIPALKSRSCPHRDVQIRRGLPQSLIAVTHDYLCVEINHYSVRMMSVQALLKKILSGLLKQQLKIIMK